jgi:fatty acid-binding protein DegV
MVRIIADTTSCLHPSVARRYAIPVIPQVINFGDESFLEGVDLDIPEFMEKLITSSELPKTAAPRLIYLLKNSSVSYLPVNQFYAYTLLWRLAGRFVLPR